MVVKPMVAVKKRIGKCFSKNTPEICSCDPPCFKGALIAPPSADPKDLSLKRRKLYGPEPIKAKKPISAPAPISTPSMPEAEAEEEYNVETIEIARPQPSGSSAPICLARTMADFLPP